MNKQQAAVKKTPKKVQIVKNRSENQYVVRKYYWMPLLCILLAFILYSPAFKAGFVNWDDNDYVLNNLSIRSLSNFSEIITTPVQGNYHPVTMLTVALNYAISGKDAGSYHFVNVLIHLVNILLVFLFVKKLTGEKPWLAFVVALLFAVHPLHVESVAWVSERKDVLYSLFFLWGLITYLQYLEKNNTRAYLLTLGLFLLSLLSKPAAIVFPAVLLAIDFYKGKLSGFRIFLEKIPFFIFALAMAFLTLHGQKLQGAVGGADLFPDYFRFFFGFYGILMYIVKTVWPVSLCTFYPFPPINQSLPIIYYISPLAFVLLILTFILTYRRIRLLAFAILFYLINLALVLQFLPVGSAIIADRYAYLPIIGLFLIPGYYLQKHIEKNKGQVTFSAAGLLIIVTVLYSVLTYRQVLTWNNSAALWEQAIKIAPSSRAYSNRGIIYKENKNIEKAIEMYNNALRLNKQEKDALINRGNIYFNSQQFEKAIEDYNACLAFDSLNYQALENRGAAYGALKKYEQALRDMKRSLDLNPNSQNGYANRGVFYQMMGKQEEAVADFYKQMEVNRETSPDLLNSIAVSYLNMQNYRKAIEVVNQAIKIEEKGAFYLNRAIAYYQMGNKVQAREDAQKAQNLGMEVNADFLRSLQ